MENNSIQLKQSPALLQDLDYYRQFPNYADACAESYVGSLQNSRNRTTKRYFFESHEI